MVTVSDYRSHKSPQDRKVQFRGFSGGGYRDAVAVVLVTINEPMGDRTQTERYSGRNRILKAIPAHDLFTDEFIFKYSRAQFQTLSDVMQACGADNVQEFLSDEHSHFISENFISEKSGCIGWWHLLAMAQSRWVKARFSEKKKYL